MGAMPLVPSQEIWIDWQAVSLAVLRSLRLGRYLYLVGNHLQVHVGPVSRDAEVGTVSRRASVVQHEQHDSSDEEHAEG